MLRGGAGGFLQWILQVTNPMPAQERTQMLDALTRVNDLWIKTIDDYIRAACSLPSNPSVLPIAGE